MSRRDTLDSRRFDQDRQQHLGELKVALDRNNVQYSAPPPSPAGERVLDIGCGAGQTLIASYPDRVSYGVDITFASLQFGRELTNQVRFVNASAEDLPFAGGQFDWVVARVSLPYTDIPAALRDIHRVLKPGGKIWITLHSLSHRLRRFGSSSWRGKLWSGYVILNGLLFHTAQRQFPLLGRRESFQTERGMRRALANAGFEVLSLVLEGDHFIVTAQAQSEDIAETPVQMPIPA